jgi:Zn-dependent metalloprotease
LSSNGGGTSPTNNQQWRRYLSSNGGGTSPTINQQWWRYLSSNGGGIRASMAVVLAQQPTNYGVNGGGTTASIAAVLEQQSTNNGGAVKERQRQWYNANNQRTLAMGNVRVKKNSANQNYGSFQV